MFIQENYPITIFRNNGNNAFALVEIEKEKSTINIRPIGDPRDFWYPESTQHFENFKVFTLIELNLEQRNECLIFDKNQSWDNYIGNIQKNIIGSAFTSHLSLGFEYINNLYFNMYNNESPPLISNDTLPNNLGLSLIKMLNSIENSIKSFTEIRNEHSNYRFFSSEQLDQFETYRKLKDILLIEVICFTANHMKSSMILTEQQKQQIDQWPKTLNAFANTSEPIEEEQILEQVNDEEPMTALRAFTSIAIFLIISFAILYGFYWLILRFEFVKFVAIALGFISFLYILSKK